MKTGLVIFAHGSRLESANQAVRAVAASVATAAGHELVEAAFLDCVAPDLPSAVDRLVRRGAERILVLPYFLTLGRHAAEDLPHRIAEAARMYPGLPIHTAAPMGGHPALVQVLLDRAREALEELQAGSGAPVGPEPSSPSAAKR